MPRELTIGCRLINDESAPYVIAEIGNNHGGSVFAAKDLIRKAAQCGVSAVKLQCRTNRTLYSQELLDKPYENEHSFGPTYGAHRAALEFNLSALSVTQCTALESGVHWFATAFDEVSADKLMQLHVPAIKLASGALTDVALQEHVAQLDIPIILSTGGGTEQDIDRAVQTITKYHTKLALLYCVASYPTQPKDANLRCILTLRNRYPDTVIGYSSHFPGLMWSLIAYAFGASIIEQHFTLDRSLKGTDHAFSLEPKGMETLCEDLKKLHIGLGDGVKRFLECERAPISKMRRVKTEQGYQITGELHAHD